MKTLTNEQIKEIAKQYGLAFAHIKAIVEVESSGSGFVNGLPKILYEPHIMYRRLGNTEVRKKLMKEHPSLCYERWGTYKYGKTSEQHSKLSIASQYDRDTALESCSWGLGQVMGYHWKLLGYESLQAFVNAMYKDEASQLDCMMRFIKANNLIPYLKSGNWARFARAYNGAGYAKNQYDIKLQRAYNKYK